MSMVLKDSVGLDNIAVHGFVLQVVQIGVETDGGRRYKNELVGNECV